ncbi:MAG TPA: DegQ family serine endoprotease [Candidatus Methylomirabilis sp.]|nr:DegQ family serine endoprotease [Candidatus Methylomirabilis sp.]
MNRSFWSHARTMLAGALIALALVAGIALGPHLGFTAGSRAPIWTERPLDVPPAPVTTPNWVQLAKELKPAVVNVSTKRVEGGAPTKSPFGQGDPFDQFFKQFGDQPRRSVRSMGSGFIINPNGNIITNNHVVESATEILVKLSDGRELAAKVMGQDAKTDLALLKIEATGLPTIALGDSSEIKVGEPVMAIGNPFGLEQTVTTGIVSATGRVIGQGPYDDFVQTDASINPGNSGGPLINARGQAIGINAAIFSQSGGSVGIGFAIPSNQAKTVVTQLAETGHVSRSWLGVSIQSLTPDLAKGFGVSDAKGALVAAVTDESPAMKAGIKAGDVITEYDGHKVGGAEDLPRLVADTPAGREVAVTVLREGKTLRLQAKVTKLDEPDQKVAAEAGEKGKLGVMVEPVTAVIAKDLGLKDATGVVVRRVEDGSPASNAGIKAGDVILEVDRQPVKDVAGLKSLIAKHAKGTPMVMLLHRDDGTMYVVV